jgi:uncharacterized protein YoxC
MNVLAISAVVLLAVLVGVLIPVLLQTRRTLKTAQEFLESVRPRLERAIDEATTAAGRINRIADTLEEGAKGVQSVARTTTDLAGSIARLRDAFRSAGSFVAAVGPALSAAVGALFAPGKPAEPGGGATPDAPGRGAVSGKERAEARREEVAR